MTDYERGFVEGLQAVSIMIQAKWDHHWANAQDVELSEYDQNAALESTILLGNLGSDVKGLGAQVHRKEIDPAKIAQANGPPFWWATADGKGKN